MHGRLLCGEVRLPSVEVGQLLGDLRKGLGDGVGCGCGAPCVAGGTTGWTGGVVVLASTAAVASKPDISDTRLIGSLILPRLRRA